MPENADSAWCVSFGALFLQRSRSRPAAVATPSSGPGSIVDASQFGFDFQPCPDVSFMYQLPSGYLVDARYFSDHGDGSDNVIDNVTSFRMAGIGITILGGGSLLNTYLTKLDGAEVNFHVPIHEGCTVFTGFRYLQLMDHFEVDAVNPSIYTKWDEENHMCGGQAGINLDFFSPGSRLQFNGVAKAGVYGNTASNRLSSVIVGGTSDSATDAAFIGEVDFTASYQITSHIACRTGYMILWVEGVALAGDVASHTVQVAGGSSSPINTNSGLWYNGATVSMDFTW